MKDSNKIVKHKYLYPVPGIITPGIIPTVYAAASAAVRLLQPCTSILVYP